MKRPRQHEIDTAAQRLFESFLPTSWVVRKQEPDYGMDYDIEIFENEEPTGISFYIQLKGTAKLDCKHNEVKFTFETDKLAYYIDKVNKPVFIVLVDIENKGCFWLFAQNYIKEILSKEKTEWRAQKTVTLYFLTNNTLPETIDLLKDTAFEGIEYVNILRFGVPNLTFAAEVQGRLNDSSAIEADTRKYKEQTAELEFRLVDSYLYEDDRSKAEEKLIEIYNSSQQDGRVEVQLYAASKYASVVNFMDKETNRIAAAYLQAALRNQKKCKRKHILIGAKASKEFLDFIYNFLGARDSAIFAQITEPQKRGSDAVFKLLGFEQSKAYLDNIDNLRNLISEAFGDNESAAAGEVIVYLAEANVFAHTYIQIEVGKEKAKSISEYTHGILEIAKKIASAINNHDLMCFVLQAEARCLFNDADDSYIEVLNEMRETARKNNLPHFEKAATSQMRTFKELGYLPEKPLDQSPPRKISDEEELNMIKFLVKRAGVNLDDEDDEIANIINIGIRDRNPERVLQFCQHLHVVITSYGLIGEMFGLPTAGGKLLYCDLTNHCVGGMSLDGIFDLFKTEYCDNCKKREPHPETWKWSAEWQEERDKNRPDGLKRILAAMYRREEKPS